MPGFMMAQPHAHFEASSYGRPGFGAGIKIRVATKGYSGPMRFIQTLPKGWSAQTLEINQDASLSIEGQQLRILWLSTPLQDTVDYYYELNIPANQPQGTLELEGRLEYYQADLKKTQAITPARLRVMPYFSRY